MAVLAIVLSYLIGSFPFGVLAARARGIDIRAYGSGNIGASNVMRVLGAKLGLLVFLLDVGKGFFAVQLARCIVSGQPEGVALWVVPAAAVAVIVGHDWSVFLRFAGGKGVASTLGACLGLCWPAALMAFGLWIVLVATTRYISVGSMASVSAFVVLAAVFRAPWQFVLAGAILAVQSIARHRDNVRRLRAGTEHRIGQRVKTTQPAATTGQPSPPDGSA